jgi:hypothetical protein
MYTPSHAPHWALIESDVAAGLLVFLVSAGVAKELSTKIAWQG